MNRQAPPPYGAERVLGAANPGRGPGRPAPTPPRPSPTPPKPRPAPPTEPGVVSTTYAVHGAVVAAARQAAGMTQEELSSATARAGEYVSRRSIQRIESEALAVVTERTLEAIAEATGTTVSDLCRRP